MRQVGTIGERILALRAGFSQVNFAKKIGVNVNTLRAYEKGRAVPNADTLFELCDKTGAAPHWILTGEGPTYEKNDATQDGSIPPDQNAKAGVGHWNQIQCEVIEKVVILSEAVAKLATQNQQLAQENAELRIKLAKMENRTGAPLPTDDPR